MSESIKKSKINLLSSDEVREVENFLRTQEEKDLKRKLPIYKENNNQDKNDE